MTASPGDDRVLLGAEHAADVVTDGDAGVLGGDHLAGAAGPHHLADPDRGQVGAGVVHPAAHRRVKRDVLDLDQHLAVAGLTDRLLGVLPVGVLGQALRPGGEPDLMVDGVHGLSLSVARRSVSWRR